MSAKASRSKRRDRAGKRCHYGCGNPATTVDHVVPFAKGGINEPWNRVPACEPCNRAKGANPGTCACGFCDLARFRHTTGLIPISSSGKPRD